MEIYEKLEELQARLSVFSQSRTKQDRDSVLEKADEIIQSTNDERDITDVSYVKALVSGVRLKGSFV